MKCARHLVVGLILGFATLASSAPLAPPSTVVNSAQLAAVPPRMQAFIEDHTIAGAVTLVATPDKVLALDAIGHADLATGNPMRTDSLFWIASMTKPITAVAVLMLQDEGKLSIEDPVAKHLPEFKDQWMIGGRTNNTLTLTKPPRAVTLRDLLTHTSGLGDLPAPRPDCLLAELAMGYSQIPLRFPPGSQWQYCNSGINTLGRVVEVVSGRPFATFLQQRVFDPLGMKNTTFWPRGSQLRRLAKSYQPGTNGGLEATDIFFVKGALDDRRRTAFPAGGLFSTAEDVARFYQMMLHQGEWRGRRILSPESVALMTRPQTGELRTGFVDGMSFGLGFAVVKEPGGVTASLSQGSFGHGGAYGTQSWADPVRGIIYVLMIQRAKLPNADASEVRRVFQETVAGAFGN